jgi:hypothetical protein
LDSRVVKHSSLHTPHSNQHTVEVAVATVLVATVAVATVEEVERLNGEVKMINIEVEIW